jgi:hypothetical protein
VSNRPLDTSDYIIEGMRDLPPTRRHTVLSLLTSRYGVASALRLEKELIGKAGGGGGGGGGGGDDGASEMGSSAHGSVASTTDSAFALNRTYAGTITPFVGPSATHERDRNGGVRAAVAVDSEDDASLKFLFIPSDHQRQAFVLGMYCHVLLYHLPTLTLTLPL